MGEVEDCGIIMAVLLALSKYLLVFDRKCMLVRLFENGPSIVNDWQSVGERPMS
jgi:hypothetical protein